MRVKARGGNWGKRGTVYTCKLLVSLSRVLLVCRAGSSSHVIAPFHRGKQDTWKKRQRSLHRVCTECARSACVLLPICVYQSWCPGNGPGLSNGTWLLIVSASEREWGAQALPPAASSPPRHLCHPPHPCKRIVGLNDVRSCLDNNRTWALSSVMTARLWLDLLKALGLTVTATLRWWSPLGLEEAAASLADRYSWHAIE